MRALILMLLLTSCTSVKYEDPSGAKYTRVSVLSNKAIGSLKLKDGQRSLTLGAYMDDTATGAAMIAKELAPLLLKSILP